MKTNTHSVIASFLLLFLFIFHTDLSAKTRPKKIDPIRFTITTDASYLSTNEEFEIKITAKYLSINPNLVYVFDGANAFKLKLIMPGGFKQTGGTYSDFVGTELTSTKPSVTYTVKGKFTSDTQGGNFQLLRSHKSAGNQSQFVQVGALAFTTISQPTDTVSAKNARIAVVNPDYVSYMTLDQFRAGSADTSRVIYINEKQKSGIFRFDQSDSSSPDDSSMVIVHSGRRYKRDYIGEVHPEWFGALRDGNTDDAKAIQKTVNFATMNGLDIYFSPGTYIIGKKITLKEVSGVTGHYNYRITLRGAGVGKTIIKGMSGFTDDMFYVNNGNGEGGNSLADNLIIIERIQFDANQASRILLVTYAVGLKLFDNYFRGGELYCVQIGIPGNNESYSVYMARNYFIGTTFNKGQNECLLKLVNPRFFVIDQMESDGGKYAIHISGRADKNIIQNCKLEGAKRAQIYIDGSGGGENRIVNNFLSPYGLSDPNAQWSGKLSAIEIRSIDQAFANGNTIIANNTIFVADPSEKELTGVFSDVSGAAKADYTLTVTGQTSGAIGLLTGKNDQTHRFVIGKITGTFVVGEQILQSSTGGIIKLDSITTTSSVAILNYGSRGLGNISNNTIKGSGTITGIINDTPGNTISGNYIEGAVGIQSSKDVTLIGNKVYGIGSAFNITGGVVKAVGNTVTGGTSNLVESYMSADGGMITGNLSLSNTTSLLAYNTTDLTNFERGYLKWGSNAYRIGVESSGSGATRDFLLEAGATNIKLNTTGATRQTFSIGPNPSSIASDPFKFIGGFSAGSGLQKFLTLAPTISQSGSAGYSVLRIAPYESSTGSGVKNLLEVGTSSAAEGAGIVSLKAWITNTGIATASQFKLTQLGTAPASATAPGSLGDIVVTASHIYVCVATNTWVRSSLSTW